MTEHICLSFDEIEKYVSMNESEGWVFVSDVVERLENCEKCEDRFSRYMAATGFWNKYVEIPAEASVPERIAILAHENIDKAKKYGENFSRAVESYLSGGIDAIRPRGTFLPAPALAARGGAASANLLTKVVFETGGEYLIQAASGGHGKFSFDNPASIDKACLIIRAMDSDYFDFYELAAGKDKLMCFVHIPAAGTYELTIIPL